jgi:putative transposase
LRGEIHVALFVALVQKTLPNDSKRHERRMPERLESLNHSVWDCKYHVVFIPKCRRKPLYGQVRIRRRILPAEIEVRGQNAAEHSG